MTLREEVIDLSEDRLDESVVGGIIVLATMLGVGAAAAITKIADKIKTKKWERAQKVEILEKKAWKNSDQEIITGFDVDNNHLKTYVIPSESFLMKFSKKKAFAAPVLNKIIIFEDYEFEDFLKEMKALLIKRYRELFDRLYLYDNSKSEKVKKFLERGLSVEFYCRGIVAFSKEQKEKIEETVKEAIKEAGIDKFKFKLLSAIYK